MGREPGADGVTVWDRLRARPLVVDGAAWLLGISLAERLPGPAAVWLGGGAAVLLVAAWRSTRGGGEAANAPDRLEDGRPSGPFGNAGPWLHAAAAIGALCLAVGWQKARQPDLSMPHVAGWNGRDVVVEGVVADEPWVRDGQVGYRVAVRTVRPLTGTLTGRAPNRDAHGLVLVQTHAYPLLGYGQRVRVRGTLEAPKPIEDFDYAAYLARRDIYAVMWRPRVTDRGPGPANPVRSALLAIKARARRALASSLPEPEASLAVGILLGDARGIPDDVDAAFRTTNTTHIIAISGSNIALLAAFLTVLAGRALGVRRSVPVVVLGLGLYTALVGADAAVVRAALMGGVTVLGVLAGRPSDAASALMGAGVAMTLYRPDYVWDLGFQLSFAATAGLVLYSSAFSRSAEGVLAERLAAPTAELATGLLNEAVLVTLAAQLTTWPLIAYHTGQVSVAGLLANALIVPAQPPVMALAALTATVGAFSDLIGRSVGIAAWVPLAYTIRSVEIVARMPYAAVQMQLSLPAMVGYYGLLGAGSMGVGPLGLSGIATALRRAVGRGDHADGAPADANPAPADVNPARADANPAPADANPASRTPPRDASDSSPAAGREASADGARRRGVRPARAGARRLERALASRPATAAAAGACLVAWLAALGRPDGLLHVDILDIGQGDAILVVSPRGRRMLVDGGPSASRVLDGLGRRMAPWDRRIDVMVMTHPDADHVGGLGAVVDRYRVSFGLEPGIEGGSEAAEWKAALARRGTPRETVYRGTRLALDEASGLAARVVWPPPELLHGTDAEANNNSVVIRLDYGGVSFLLTGDLEEPGEAALEHTGEDLRVTVLKVGHHGSHSSTSPPFLASTSPAVAVISVGQDNRYGHPAPDVMARLEALPLWRTDRDGTIELISDGRGLWVRTG